MPVSPKTLRPRGSTGVANRDYEARRKQVPWRAWYKLRRWQEIRDAQLNAEPLCRECLKVDRVTAATTCDHVEPHRGDPVKFWCGRFQSLCTPCHSSGKQRAEAATRD